MSAEPSPTSWCGLYCGACEVYVAHGRARATGTEARWEDLPARYREKLPRKGPVVCEGCTSDTVYAGCAVCPIRKCARTMTGIQTCLDCLRYPCFRHSLVRLAWWLARLERKLPHLQEVRRNQEEIRRRGLAGWLEDQDLLWRCPACGERFTWYQAHCGCGADLTPVRRFPLPPA